MDALVLPLGLIAVGLVVLRLGLHTYSSWQRLRQQQEQDRLSADLLRQQIDTAKRDRQTSALAWNGYRKFVVDRKVEEAAGVCSFYLVPHDHKPLPPYRPGRYLTFRLNIPGREKPVIRCYSLSDHPRPECYRITIKRVASPPKAPTAPPGLVSNYFHEQIGEDDILDAQAPRGHFVLDPDKERPAVLIAGGVGVTPLLSMVNSVVEAQSGREILFFYGVRNRAEHAFKEHLEDLTQQHANVRLVVCYSQPTEQDEEGEGRDYDHHGWVNVELIRSYLQTTNYEFFICGPPPMMETLTHQLTQWGVAKRDIFTEAFGPATVSKAFGHSHAAAPAAAGEPQEAVDQVTFAKTGKTCRWKSEAENLLDFATANGVEIESGCRAGNCGTCVVAVKQGSVTYLTEHGAEIAEGTCLTCIAAPNGDVVLDA